MSNRCGWERYACAVRTFAKIERRTPTNEPVDFIRSFRPVSFFFTKRKTENYF